MKNNKEESNYKKKYQAVRHHAWAGSVILAILLSLRILVEISEYTIKHFDLIILLLGVIIIIYTLTALFFTYKYRKGILIEEKPLQIITETEELEKEKIKADVEKERLKIEKKKTKTEAKKIKKK